MNRIFDLKNASLLGILWRISTLELGSVGTLAGFCSTIDSYFPEAKKVLILLSKLLKIILNNFVISLLIFVLINSILAYILLKIFKKSKTHIINSEVIKENLPPKKRMAKILLVLSKYGETTLSDKQEGIGISIEQLNAYIEILCEYKYIIHTETAMFHPIIGNRYVRYKILAKGSMFLQKNGFLKHTYDL